MQPQPDFSAAVVWLHGDGDSGKHWFARFKEGVSRIKLPWINFCFPDARNQRWFDYELPIWDGASEFGGGLDAAVASIHTIIANMEASGIKPSRIVLGGHGPGGALALLAGRTWREPLAGIAMIGGWVLRPQQLATASAAARAPVLVCHGEEDDDIPFELFSHTCQWLSREGHEVESQAYAGLGQQECAEAPTVLAAPKNFFTRLLPPVVDSAKRAAARKHVEAAKAELRGESPPTPCCHDADELEADHANEAGAERAGAEGVGAEQVDAARGKASAEGTEASAGAEAFHSKVHSHAHSQRTACRLISVSDDESGEALVVILSLEGVTSVSEVDLSVGTTRLEVRLAGGPEATVLSVPLPRAVDPGEMDSARFSKRTGQLRVTLHCAGSFEKID